MTKFKTSHDHYQSITECEAACLSDPMLRAHNTEQRNSYRNRSSGKSWYGVEGGSAAVIATVAAGWDAGAALVDTAYDAVREKIPASISFGRKRHRGETGDELDINAVLAGNISTAWSRTKRAARLGNGNIRIVVDVCANAGTDSETLAWRGVAALTLARTLLEARYSVEIVAAAGVSNAVPGENTIVSCVVKARSEHTDTRMLAATCALSGFFRTHLFCALVRAADIRNKDVNTSLGFALELEGIYPADSSVTQIVTPATITSREKALAWVVQSQKFLQNFTIDREAN